jgi:hypothetical protein
MPLPGTALVEDGAMGTGTDDGDRPPPLDLERLAEVEAELTAVEHALGRLDAGTWGTCEVCDGPVEADLLARHPGARTCAAHAGPVARAEPPPPQASPLRAGGAW